MKKTLLTVFVFALTLFITTASHSVYTGKSKVATLSGGCFWCVESTFEKLSGVYKAVSGYTGGTTKNPTYKKVGKGGTGHAEAVQIYYDAEKISYNELLYHYWKEIDPTDNKGQFADRGEEYRPAIFYNNEDEKNIALASKEALEKSGKFSDPIIVEILPLEKFYKAEEYHQNYYKKNPLRYKLYRTGSGRDRFLQQTWGNDLKKPYQKTKSTENSETSLSGEHKYLKFTKTDDATLKKANQVVSIM